MRQKEQIRVVGAYISDKFGELWDKSLYDLIEMAAQGVLKNAKYLDSNEIDAVFISNMASGQFSNQLHLNAILSQEFSHFPPAIRIEGACASGGLAMLSAQDAIRSGRCKTVLVLGVEKMTDVSSGEVTSILSSAANYEKEYGSTFPALYALIAQAYKAKYGLTRNELSAVSIKNHKHALSNPNAQFRKEVSVDQVGSSPLVADPLRLLDCSPVSDGSSAVILSVKNSGIAQNGKKINYLRKPIIVGVGHGQDSLDLVSRRELTSFGATIKASQQAYEQAGITANDITIAEVHDCFTIAEIIAIEDLGFFKKGSGAKATKQGKTTHGGKILINPSGGLKACGHPIGATGVKQIAYLSDVLEKNPQKIDEKYLNYAVAHNVGGSGATAVVQVLKKGS